MTEMLRKFMQSVHKDARWITPVDKKVIHQWIKLSTGGQSYPQVDKKVIHQSYPHVESGTKSNITESKEGETMSSTNTVSGAYTRVGELEAASCKRAASEPRAASSIRGAVISETTSYIYTREVVSYTEDWYFIDFKPNRARGCTVYKTEEEAIVHIKEEARLFGHKAENASIRHEVYHGFKVLHHRYKKG